MATSSSQVEFHHKALTEPCLIVSHHTALSDQGPSTTKGVAVANE